VVEVSFFVVVCLFGYSGNYDESGISCSLLLLYHYHKRHSFSSWSLDPKSDATRLR
jgi:hypothetical protein